VGRLLYGEPEHLPQSIGPHAIGEVMHHDVHRGMVADIEEEHERIQLHFPGLERSDLSLRSEDGVLFVGVNGREQAIPTETYVKSSLVKASLEGDVLALLIPRSSS
jgi:HSP20 family molecular chaperone IbpA